MYGYLIGSFIALAIWAILYFNRKDLEKKMLWSSMIALPLGFTEMLFVPAYWSPKTLFNLTQRFGVDIESFIFSFAIAGIASVLYDEALKFKIVKDRKSHPHHSLVLLSMPIAYEAFKYVYNANPIYNTIFALFAGALGLAVVRRDLTREIIYGGAFFMLLYFALFALFNKILYPGYTGMYYNLGALSGILLLGVPIEEILFALGVGMVWAPLYEDVKNYRVIENKKVIS